MCGACSRFMHEKCPRTDSNGNCCCLQSTSQELVEQEDEDADSDWRNTRVSRRGAGKRDESLRDQQSTGRKRAAVRYPLDRTAPCEWQGLRFAGGGDSPIIGCLDGLQQARHHGPDKNTLNNDEGNVHRICHVCHNKWHSRNDEGYAWGSVYKPHDQVTLATPEQQFADLKEWSGKTLKKVVD